jgi:2-polyprenyl-3-methyl-5-hydroxy-6-metoxy-1,4-benzoquinol methylase
MTTPKEANPPKKQPGIYTTKEGWDERYTSHSALKAAGTFVHTDSGNMQFYRTKFDAIDRVMKLIGTTMRDSAVLDAAGGTGKYVEYFLSRGVAHLTVADFSQKALDVAQEYYGNDERITTMFLDLKSTEQVWQREYDFAFVLEAIHLLPTDEDVAQAIHNLRNALKVGGHVVISDIYPTETIPQNEYIVRRSKATFEQLMRDAGFAIVGYVPQSLLFERQVFRRFQPMIEQTGSLFYWLNRFGMALGLRPPKDSTSDVKYLVGRREP